MYTSSYEYVSTYILGTKNKTKHGTDNRHHGQEGKKKNMVKYENPNSDYNIEFFL